MPPLDPRSNPVFARFSAIHALLRENHAWDNAWLRFAAQAGVMAPGGPREVATAIMETADALRADAGLLGALHTPLRFVIAALLVQAGDRVPAFTADLERTRQLFRESGIVHGGAHEGLAILFLRLANGLRPASREQAGRLREIHARLRIHHWWSTGPQDLPGCALLVDLPGTPEEVAQRVEEHYQRLHHDGFIAGTHLVQAAVILALARLDPLRAVHRFGSLVHRFALHEATPVQSDYGAIAVLCLLDLAPATIVGRTLTLQQELAGLRPLLSHQIIIDLTAHLVFLDLVHQERLLGRSVAAVDQTLERTIRDAQAASASIACLAAIAVDPATC